MRLNSCALCTSMQEDRGLQPFCPPCILWLAFSALAQIVRRLRSPISFPLCHGDWLPFRRTPEEFD